MIANASMDCDGHVVVTITNDNILSFHGQSATADSWIIPVDLGPGESKAITAVFKAKSESGRVAGALADGTKVSAAWSATRDVACGAPTTTAPPPVDTTPHQAVIGGVTVCIVPGSPTQEPVPCDSPRATTPDPTTTTTEPPAAPVVTAAAPVATEAPKVHTGPPKAHHVVAVKPTAPATLPVTGASPAIAIDGTMCLLAGIALVCLTRRRARTA